MQYRAAVDAAVAGSKDIQSAAQFVAAQQVGSSSSQAAQGGAGAQRKVNPRVVNTTNCKRLRLQYVLPSRLRFQGIFVVPPGDGRHQARGGRL
eukprot:7841449-Alexandrium_andersonii.AAC.1